jgi:tRNA nucleotidyltransferase (CCA-adding enzyme)
VVVKEMTKWAQLRSIVLEKIKPMPIEEEKVREFSLNILKKINSIFIEHGFKVEAEIHGSVAHGTWISDERDIDVFLVIKEGHTRRMLLSVLDLLKESLGFGFVEAYAEHPYLKATVEGYNVDFVPCFRIKEGMNRVSSTDRTPLHTAYLEGRLDDNMKDEVRLVKQFAKGIGVYGAEIRVGGLSGYLCELLVLKYGSIIILLQAASRWRKYSIIHFDTSAENSDLRAKFKDPLILIDPVDPNRNVASALSNYSFWNFVAAAQRFIDEPKVTYFFPEQNHLDSYKILEMLSGRGTDLLFLVIEEAKADVPDSLWGQLLKSKQALERLFIVNDFVLLRSNVWSNEESRHIFTFEFESINIPIVSQHKGPPVSMKANSDKFIKEHKEYDQTVIGPEIQDGRWVVFRRRQWNNAKALLQENLYDGGTAIGVSHKLTIRILQNHRILKNEEIVKYVTDEFAEHIYKFLVGRPAWIE